MVHNPLFDNANTRQVMESRNISFPILDYERIFMLFDYAAANGWGKQNNGSRC
jgi:hypothetical protein